ncbi:MAG: GDSL-type esterase/lipase family protein, partial [Verrucomicrobiia bacterium]|jgi:hypothetical protein
MSGYSITHANPGTSMNRISFQQLAMALLWLSFGGISHGATAIADRNTNLFLPLVKPAKPIPAVPGHFAIERSQTIVMFGGANAAESQRSGWLETRLVSAHPNHRLQIRNLAWPTDTVSEQSRPRNFFSGTDPAYGEKDGRASIKADMAFLWFGQMESLAGRPGVPAFEQAYQSLIARLSTYTRRIVLITPVPFEDPLDLGLNLKQRNRDLSAYAAVIRRLATEHRLPVVDLTSAFQNRNATADGAMLSDEGHELAALTFARQLGLTGQLPPFSNYIRETIQEKNALWQRYLVPSNWAFLYGNRQSQPSSRSHTYKQQRWFPGEIEALLPRIQKLESEIHDKVKSEAK